jgi:alpha-tubulin suppressor-like RCC1 family protein
LQYVSRHFAFTTVLNHSICKVLSSSIDKVLTPRRVGALKEVKSIACGAHHTLALCGGGSIGSGSSLKAAKSHGSSSSVFAFGRGSSGELGCGQCVV